MKTLQLAAENRTTVIVAGGALIIAGALVFILTHSARPQPAPPPPPITMVVIQPPKPPPPPPPLPQPKIITPPKMTSPVTQPVTKPVVTNTPPKAPSASHVGTSIHGNSPNAFDLSGTPGGLGFGNGNGDGSGGSAMGYYESQMQQQIQQALVKNPVTRKFSGTLALHVTLDAKGMVTAVSLDKSSGDPKVDDAVTNNVLRSLHFGAIPDGMSHTFPMNMTGEQPL